MMDVAAEEKEVFGGFLTWWLLMGSVIDEFVSSRRIEEGNRRGGEGEKGKRGEERGGEKKVREEM